MICLTIVLWQKNSTLATNSKFFLLSSPYNPLINCGFTDQKSRACNRKDIVIMFRDNTSVENSSIRVLAPTEIKDTVVDLGPIPLFNWFPLNLIISITLISMFLISLGVYALIFPLERKLQLHSKAVSPKCAKVFNTKVKVVGEDEIAHLAATFNGMTEHIRCLI